jgi:hypothetical protein
VHLGVFLGIGLNVNILFAQDILLAIQGRINEKKKKRETGKLLQQKAPREL